VVAPPMQLNVDYRQQGARALYAEWARGGCGAVILPWTSVDMFLSDDLWGERGSVAGFVAGCRRIVDDVHDAGARVGIQLNHAKHFPSGIGMDDTRGRPVAPSPSEGRGELTVAEIETIISKFARAAAVCREAGFDFVELHNAHGYLPCEFFSPLDNRRDDRYGGDLRRRMNFGLEAITAMRSAVGGDYPLFCRLGAQGGRPGDTTIEDAVEFAVALEKAGVDCLDISIAKPGLAGGPVPGPDRPAGTFAHLAGAVKRGVGVPVIAVGRINRLEVAEAVLTEGWADLIAVGRQLIADPHWPRKAAAGRQDEVCLCLSCNVCLDSLWDHQGLRCSVNPFAGRDAAGALEKVAAQRKKVLVIGGGPAGLEAAATLAERGHRVDLWEKEPRLGGQLALAAVPPHKGEIGALIEYLARRVARAGAGVSLGTEATPARIEKLKPDAVVLATGARPVLPEIPGIDGPLVAPSADILAGKVAAGRRVAIIGGGLVGCETADYLADGRREVTVMRRGETFAADVNPLAREVLLERLGRKGVVLLPGVKYERINGKGVVISMEGKTRNIPADTVVVATGVVSETGLLGALRAGGWETYLIGDAASPGKIADALADAARVGREI
jgi:2,4-dienoyl-CoA reductase-like NADH-dependent reductase (Old Yellow Enzyme family)/thioredoxin reductase